MLFSTLLLSALSTLAAAQSGVLSFTRVPNPITDGETNVLLWQTNNTQTPVTIILQKGPVTSRTNVTTVTTKGTGGQYLWTPHASLADGTDYWLLATQDDEYGRYGPFVIQGANPAAVSSLSHSIAASLSSSISRNMSRTEHTASMGTGSPMHRNTTTPHFTHHMTNTMGGGAGGHHHTTSTPTAHITNKPTRTNQISSSSSTTNAAVKDISTSSSSIALVLGAMAAIFCLH